MPTDLPWPQRSAVDPLEMTRQAIADAHELLHAGFPEQGRTLFRSRLEAVLASMCPICGRTDDHEAPSPREHRFVGPRTRVLRG